MTARQDCCSSRTSMRGSTSRPRRARSRVRLCTPLVAACCGVAGSPPHLSLRAHSPPRSGWPRRCGCSVLFCFVLFCRARARPSPAHRGLQIPHRSHGWRCGIALWLTLCGRGAVWGGASFFRGLLHWRQPRQPAGAAGRGGGAAARTERHVSL